MELRKQPSFQRREPSCFATPVLSTTVSCILHCRKSIMCLSAKQSANRQARRVNNTEVKLLLTRREDESVLREEITMTTSVNPRDPRVKRTRQLLLQAFIALLEERHNLHSISVQEVAERATVNRATFYAHFEDKYALLQCWMHQKYHQRLTSQFPASS